MHWHSEDNTHTVNTWDEFREIINSKGGFILAHWDGTAETEEQIKEATKATIRCIPLDAEEEDGVCLLRKTQQAQGSFCQSLLITSSGHDPDEFHLIIQGTVGRDHAKVTALCAIAHIRMQPDLCLSTLLQ